MKLTLNSRPVRFAVVASTSICLLYRDHVAAQSAAKSRWLATMPKMLCKGAFMLHRCKLIKGTKKDMGLKQCLRQFDGVFIRVFISKQMLFLVACT